MPKFTPAPFCASRFDQKAWQRYRPVIQRYLTLHPAQWSFIPQGLSPETAASRMRDAIRGYLTFHHEPTDVDPDRLKEVYENISIRTEEAVVQIGPKGVSKDLSLLCEDDNLLHLAAPTQLEVSAILLLANNSRFNNRKILLEQVSDDIKVLLCSDDVEKNFPNTIVEVVDDHTFRIL